MIPLKSIFPFENNGMNWTVYISDPINSFEIFFSKDKTTGMNSIFEFPGGVETNQ